ncbi:hypothetical protein E2320_012463, partial [Naja naja]
MKPSREKKRKRKMEEWENGNPNPLGTSSAGDPPVSDTHTRTFHAAGAFHPIFIQFLLSFRHQNTIFFKKKKTSLAHVLCISPAPVGVQQGLSVSGIRCPPPIVDKPTSCFPSFTPGNVCPSFPFVPFHAVNCKMKYREVYPRSIAVTKMPLLALAVIGCGGKGKCRPKACQSVERRGNRSLPKAKVLRGGFFPPPIMVRFSSPEKEFDPSKSSSILNKGSGEWGDGTGPPVLLLLAGSPRRTPLLGERARVSSLLSQGGMGHLRLTSHTTVPWETPSV